ncbi:hypothetical protein PENSPDRAFT_596212 [Peniophora sp. CONT]|nr:hypothetical protein PENSPDRAFT_596212 [Peniophora sp. CONT]
MGSDFCSIPATSVDAERAFSGGRRAVDFMQHNTSSQTFRARMGVGSWYGTPLLGKGSIPSVIDIVQQKMDGKLPSLS